MDSMCFFTINIMYMDVSRLVPVVLESYHERWALGVASTHSLPGRQIRELVLPCVRSRYVVSFDLMRAFSVPWRKIEGVDAYVHNLHEGVDASKNPKKVFQKKKQTIVQVPWRAEKAWVEDLKAFLHRAWVPWPQDPRASCCQKSNKTHRGTPSNGRTNGFRTRRPPKRQACAPPKSFPRQIFLPEMPGSVAPLLD